MNNYGGDLFTLGHVWRTYGNAAYSRCKWCSVTRKAVSDGRASKECAG